MEFALIIWLISSLEAINNVLLLLVVLAFFGAIGFAIGSVDYCFSNEKRFHIVKHQRNSQLLLLF